MKSAIDCNQRLIIKKPSAFEALIIKLIQSELRRFGAATNNRKPDSNGQCLPGPFRKNTPSVIVTHPYFLLRIYSDGWLKSVSVARSAYGNRLLPGASLIRR